MEHFFSRIQVKTCAQIQIIGRDADKHHTQISNYCWGYSQIIREIYPPHPPRVLAPLTWTLAILSPV